MIPRSILVAEDLDYFTDQGKRRGQTVRGVAKDFSRLLREEMSLFYVEDQQDLQHEKILKEIAKEVSGRTRYEIHTGSPSDEILKATRRWPRPEMVVMGTQGHTGLEKVLEGSVAETVLLKSVRPVMVIGPRAQEKLFRLGNSKHLKILVATDLTRESRPAEEYAMSLAARTGGEVTLLHSFFEKIKRVHEASIMSGFVSFDMDRIFQKMQRDAKADLMVKVAKMRKAMVDCHYVVSDPRKNLNEVLKDEISKSYSLVVMGTHSKRNALLRAFLGSTARDIILQSEVPVVIVHSH